MRMSIHRVLRISLPTATATAALVLLLGCTTSDPNAGSQHEFSAVKPTDPDGLEEQHTANSNLSPSEAIAALAKSVFEREIVDMKDQKFGVDPQAGDFGIDAYTFHHTQWTSNEPGVGIKNFKGDLNDFFFAVAGALNESDRNWHTAEFTWVDKKHNAYQSLRITIERMFNPGMYTVTVADMALHPSKRAPAVLFKDNSQVASVRAKRAFQVINRSLKPHGDMVVQNLHQATPWQATMGDQNIMQLGGGASH